MAIAVSSATQTNLSIQLPHFEGPLALLLYLIRKEEMDIMDIQIHNITGQYLEYIKMIKELNLEVAGEFISMAATLIQIKSKMLLPQYDENGEIVENDDPRKELVQRLLEYQKYQEAAKSLYDRPLLGRDVWTRGIREDFESDSLKQQQDAVVVDDNPVFSLISAYRKVLKSAKNKVHKVAAKLQSIASRILEIRQLLKVGVRVPMTELMGVNHLETDAAAAPDKRRKLLITFLSLLELGKLGFISLFQTENYTEIYVEAKKDIVEEALSSVEEYNTVQEVNYEQKAAALAAKENFSLSDADEDSPELDSVVPAQMSFVAQASDDSLDMESIASDEEIAQAELDLEKEQPGGPHEQQA